MAQDIPAEVIIGLYETAGTQDAWNAALRKLTSVLDADVGHLVLIDKTGARPPDSVMVGHLGDMAEANTAHLTYYGQIDPRLPVALRTPAGEVFACHHHVDETTAQRHEFYADFLRPNGVRYLASGRIFDSGRETAFMSILHRTGRDPFQADELTRLRALLPHVGGALKLRRLTARLEAEQGGLQAALGGLDRAVFLLDSAQQVIWMNELAEALVAGGDGLLLVRGMLTASGRQDAQRLRDLLAQAVAPLAGLADGKGRGGEIALQRPSGGSPLLAAAVPVPAPTATRWGAPAARAAVHVIEPDRRPRDAGRRLGVLFGLTPGEQKLALALLEGQSLPEIAEARGVSRETLRTLLGRIFDKTGCHRQAQVVALFARCLALPD